MRKGRAGLLQTVSNEVLNGGYACDLPEKPAQILAVAGDRLGQLLKGDRLGIVLLDVGDDRLIPADLPGIRRRYGVSGRGEAAEIRS